jgi:hypothetical protein
MAGNEYYEAKGALTWLPVIKLVVQEAIQKGIVKPEEQTLAENLMLGVVGVEAGGDNPGISQPHGWAASQGVPNPSSDGLTQLIPWHMYSNENPFDPLTNLRAGLRTLWRYYRGYGNRWDLALMEHLTGDVSNPGKVDDLGKMTGAQYPDRVRNVVNTARQLVQAGDIQGWHVDAQPYTPFYWVPPFTSRAYELYSGNTTQPDYYQKVQAAGVNLQFGNLDKNNLPPGSDPSLNQPVPSPVATWRTPTAQELENSQKPHYPAVRGRDYDRSLAEAQNVPPPSKVETTAAQNMKIANPSVLGGLDTLGNLASLPPVPGLAGLESVSKTPPQPDWNRTSQPDFLNQFKQSIISRATQNTVRMPPLPKLPAIPNLDVRLTSDRNGPL